MNGRCQCGDPTRPGIHRSIGECSPPFAVPAVPGITERDDDETEADEIERLESEMYVIDAANADFARIMGRNDQRRQQIQDRLTAIQSVGTGEPQ